MAGSQPHLRSLSPALLAVPMSFLLAGCSRGDRPGGEVRQPSALSAPQLAEGSVGRAAYQYRLSLPGMAKWYAVVRALRARAAADSTFEVALNFPAGSSVASQEQAVEATPALREAVRAAGLSAREFVVITAAYGGALAAERMRDSLAVGERPANVHPENLTFLRAHQAQLDSLAAQ